MAAGAYLKNTLRAVPVTALATRQRRSNRRVSFLGVLRRQLCLLATTEFWMPSLKSGAEIAIENVHPHLQ